MILYHYVHCPYCLRVRMALGYLNISYKSVVLPYDDENTPNKLTGIKMLPIFEFGDHAINESMDIIKRLDVNNKIKLSREVDELENITKDIGKFVHPLAMPIWIYTKEFNDSSRKYFLNKKIRYKGPFEKLHKNKGEYFRLAYDFFQRNKKLFNIVSGKSLGDQIMISSHLYGLYMVPDFSFPDYVHQYIQETRHMCNFDYHIDYWR